MKEFFDIIDRMLKETSSNKHLINTENLNKCIKLINEGWKIKDYQSINKSNSINIVFVLNDSEDTIRLTFQEQMLWVKYLEKREEINKNGNSI